MVKNETQVLSISGVVEHYVKSFSMPDSVVLISYDFIMDPVKDKIMLNLVLDVQEEVPSVDEDTPTDI